MDSSPDTETKSDQAGRQDLERAPRCRGWLPRRPRVELGFSEDHR
jgi:hypothetical protein